MVPTNNSYRFENPKSLLFTPLKMKDVELKNRIVVSPMCQYSSVDGFASSWHLAHLGQYAVRGAGLVIMEATGVLPNGRITPHCAGIWKDEHIPPLLKATNFVHSQGSLIGIQLAHAGRKASCYSPFMKKGYDVLAPVEDGGWPDNIIGPSAIRGWPQSGIPREASLEEIRHVVKAFGHAAERAYRAGFDVIEIHGAHGYLIHSFLSPLTNHRTDEFGGSFENRVRLLVEIIKEVKRFWPASRPIFVRISCSDWADGGWDSEDSVRLAALMAQCGVDLIDCSSAGLVPTQQLHASLGPSQKSHAHEPGWNTRFSKAIVEHVPNILASAVGGITDANYAESILKDKKAHLVMIGREFLRNPTWVHQAAMTLEGDAVMPLQYLRSRI
jgi:2,4-dienoyl-CoA reductase-like NADH-dependent reductase (Old Yellow Enzyme family)